MNTNIPEEKLAGIREALFQGQMIEAIKLYRECTSTGLAEAKTAVEKLEAELRTNSPEKFATKSAGKGCLGGRPGSLCFYRCGCCVVGRKVNLTFMPNRRGTQVSPIP